MKILHFAHCFIPVYGGTTTRLYNLLTDGINEHYLYVPQTPSIYIPDDIDTLKNEESFGNIKVRRCKLFKGFKLKIPLFSTLRYVTISSDKLANSVKEEIDIVHGHNPLEFAVAAMKYVKKKNIPFVYEAHNLMADAPIFNKRPYIPKVAYLSIRQLFKLKEKKIFQSADVIITQTNVMKKRIVKVFGINEEKIKIIPNGVDENKFNPIRWYRDGRELRKKKKWEGKIVFMYSGFLDDINGVEFFLNSLRELPDSIRQRIKVVVIGRGSLQKYVGDMSRRESNLIEYLGLVDYNKMPIYYSTCDVFVIPRPSTLPAENLIPMKLLEAMAMEKIVLGSDVGGITEVVKNDKSGIIFKKENKDDLLKKISYILENIENMGSIRKQARKDIIKKYSWKKSRERLQNVYETVI